MSKTHKTSPIAVGRVVRPHGIRGELKIRLYNPTSSALSTGSHVHLQPPQGTSYQAVLDSARDLPGGFVLGRIDGVSDRDAAERLRDCEVLMDRDDIGTLDEDEFYIADIMGARVEVEGDDRHGQVIDYIAYPAAEVLVVQIAGDRFEVPLLDDFLVSVDDDDSGVRVVLRGIDGFVVEK